MPRIRRRWITVAVVAALTFVPLVGTLGYENGFVLAPLASLLGIAIGVDGVRSARAAPSPEGRGVLRRLALDGAGQLGLLAALAVATLFVGRLWQPGCDPWGGLAFFVMGPMASACVGWVCGIWGGVLGRRRSTALLYGVTPMVISTLIGLYRIYADPVVFAYDPFWGYFSGSVYDEAVSVGSTYLWFRGYNGLAAGVALLFWTLFVAPRALRTRRPEPSVGSAALATIALLGLFTTAFVGIWASQFRFTADTDSITEVLTGRHETEHFVIHYAPRSSEARTIEAIAAEHEFAWHRLATIMNGREPQEKVHSFIFASPEQKRALMGAGTVQVAAPWRGQIYLDHRPFPHPVLHHELAHAFGATVGDPWFGISRRGFRVNVGLIEGFATALAPRAADRLDLHDQATVLERLDLRPSLQSIMGPNFLTQSSRVAYTTAGSFCLWLIETRGFDPMAELYRSAGDFEAAYGESLDVLEAKWLAFLDTRDGVTEEDVRAQAERFKRRSVFERPCAHKVADVRGDIAMAQARMDLDEAVEGWQRLCALEPSSPIHKVGLAHGLAVADRFDEARSILSEAASMSDLTATLIMLIAERRGDLELAAGDLGAAREAYETALAQPLGDDKLRVLQLKLLATTERDLSSLLHEYFSPFDPLDTPIEQALVRLHHAFAIAELPGREALGQYLVARQLLNADRYSDAVKPLEQALSEDGAALPSAEFIRAAREALMTSYLLTRRYDEARTVLSRLRQDPDLGNGHRLEYEYWSDRIDFFERYFD